MENGCEKSIFAWGVGSGNLHELTNRFSKLRISRLYVQASEGTL